MAGTQAPPEVRGSPGFHATFQLGFPESTGSNVLGCLAFSPSIAAKEWADCPSPLLPVGSVGDQLAHVSRSPKGHTAWLNQDQRHAGPQTSPPIPSLGSRCWKGRPLEWGVPGSAQPRGTARLGLFHLAWPPLPHPAGDPNPCNSSPVGLGSFRRSWARGPAGRGGVVLRSRRRPAGLRQTRSGHLCAPLNQPGME